MNRMTISNSYVVVLFFTLSVTLYSCIRNTQEVIPADTSKRWLGYRQNSDDTIITKDGYAYLTTYKAISANGTSIVSNNKMKGNFEMKITYSDFVASGSNSFSDQLIFDLSRTSATNPIISASLTNEDLYMDDSTRASISKNTINRSGEFYVKRTGSSIYSWIRAGDDSLFLNRTDYYAEDLSISMKVYSSDNTTSRTSVHIDDIWIKGAGGAVKSNTFDGKTIKIIY